MTRAEPDSRGGLSLQTLLISSIAAVAAAIVVPLIWEKGTLIATALSPIVVAVVSEALRKPAEVIGAAAPRVTRRTNAAREQVPIAERFDPLPPAERFDEPALAPDDPFGLRGARVTRSPRQPWWKLGLATGVLAFVIGAGAVTASELALFGSSVSDSGRTTLFGGAKADRSTPSPTPAVTATPGASPEATPTPTPTATPTAVATPTPSTEAAPAPAEPAPPAVPAPTP
jgi:hypothetical protein